MKKVFALILALVMVFALCACGQQAPAESKAPDAAETPAAELTATEADWALADQLRAVYEGWEEGSDWTVAYICKGLDGTWFSTEFASVEATCLAMGAAQVISYDCQYDAAKQIEYTENAIAQGVDFIIYVPCDETVSTACVSVRDH